LKRGGKCSGKGIAGGNPARGGRGSRSGGVGWGRGIAVRLCEGELGRRGVYRFGRKKKLGAAGGDKKNSTT